MSAPVTITVAGASTSCGRLQRRRAVKLFLRAGVYRLFHPCDCLNHANYAHTDNAFTVIVQSRNVVEDAAVRWHIDDIHGLRQNWGAYVARNLTTEPNDIWIKHGGVFTLGCEITNPTGRMSSFSAPSIEVLAEQELQMKIIEQQIYTSEMVQMRTPDVTLNCPWSSPWKKTVKMAISMPISMLWPLT